MYLEHNNVCAGAFLFLLHNLVKQVLYYYIFLYQMFGIMRSKHYVCTT